MAGEDGSLSLAGDHFRRWLLAIFPNITSEIELVHVLNQVVRESARWTLHRRMGVASPSGGMAIGIDWRTSAGQIAEVMGFAPFPTMPVTRRAPYVAISAWPGGFKNPHRMPNTSRSRVSFVHVAHELLAERHDRMYSDTETGVGSLLAETGDQARQYRKVAFVIGRRFAEDVRFSN